MTPDAGQTAGQWLPTATTRLAGVIGDPVRHSLSPLVHNAAFRALDLDWAFVAFEVPAGAGGDAVRAMATLGLAGLSVTMPHKADAAAAVDELSATAEALGAVNTVVARGRRLVGENTDGEGFLAALSVDEGFDVAGRRCLVLGGGGAARAVVRALGGAGAAEVVVVNRTAARAAATAALAASGRVGVAHEAGEADLIVNATSLGMRPEDPLPLDPVDIGPGQLVVDLVYHPAVTPLIEAARARGAGAVNGLGMLIHQAARAFRLWTGEDPPTEVMSAAALGALARQ